MPLHSDTPTSFSLRRLLRPRSIALVGASETPGSLGESVLANLERAAFAGELHLVNPKRSHIRGKACLPSVDALPLGVDCAVLAIPGSAVLEAFAACARREVGSAVVFSAGFAESGEPGRALQFRLSEMARERGIAVEGPNCLGMVNYVDGVPLTFIGTRIGAQLGTRSGAGIGATPGPAGVAVVSQSGALAAVLGVNLIHHGLNISYSISTGNEAVCGVEDFLDHLIDDDTTLVFALIVEQFRQPQRFLALAARARIRGKFIVLLHPGSSVAARHSATTHTGVLAGDREVMRAKVGDAGVIVVDTLEELADAAQMLIRRPVLPHGGAAVFAESGAFKALALDFCEQVGLDLPTLSASTADALRRVLPAFIAPSNPMDLTAQGLVDPELYRKTLPPILADDRFGSVLMAIILTDVPTCDLKFPPILAAIRSLASRKPLLFAALDEGAPAPKHYIDELRSLGVPFFPSPERAFRALAHLTRSAERPQSSPLAANAAASYPLPAGVVPEYRTKLLLERAGIPIPSGALAQSLDEALALASRIGYPVALKAQSSELAHKSDAGGVELNLRDADALAAAWARLHRNIEAARADIVLDGVLVEQMGKPGVELIAGARNDPDWGPILLVGFGGLLAEALRDVRLLVPGLSIEAIAGEIGHLKCAALLRGFRGAPPVDVAAAAHIVAALGEIMVANPSIQEIEINPILVYPEGSGALAVDAVMRVGADSESAADQKSIGNPT